MNATTTHTTTHATRRPIPFTADLIGAPGLTVQAPAAGGIFGVPEYVTADGWVGVRQPGGRLDEAPLALVEIDPT